MTFDPRRFLPHRPPLLLVDGVSQREPGQWAICYKNVSSTEWFFGNEYGTISSFSGGNLVMPPMLVVEAICQATAFVYEEPSEALSLLAQLDAVRFYYPPSGKQPEPGDKLELVVEPLASRSGLWFGRGHALVNGINCVEIGKLVVSNFA